MVGRIRLSKFTQRRIGEVGNQREVVRVTSLLRLLQGGQFACRICSRLTYPSQLETPMDRGIGRARKVRVRLGGSPNLFSNFPEKPMGMHWTTYMRLRTSALAAEDRLLTVRLNRFSNWGA